MIETSMGEPLNFNGSKLETRISWQTKLDSNHNIYDLKEVVDIIVTFQPEVDGKTNDYIKAKKRKNISIGAALGLVADYSEGSDTVIDGAIYGAALGWLFSTESRKEEKAEVVLVFSDASRLAISADKKSLNHLFSLVGNGGENKADKPITSRTLNSSEKIQILCKKEKVYSYFASVWVALLFILFPPISFYPPKETTELEYPVQAMLHDVSNFFSVSTLQLWIAGLIVGFLGYRVFRVCLNKFYKYKYM